MGNNTIVLAAVAVFIVAVTLMVVELRRARRSRRGPALRASPSAPPALATRVASPVDDAAVDDEDGKEAAFEDLTRMAPSIKPPAALPRLRNSEVPEEPTSNSMPLTIFETDAQVDEPTGNTNLILLTAAAQSDRGMRRRNNEDAYLVDEKHGLFVVADGMGGYAGGDIASRMAVDSIQQVFAAGPIEAPENPGRPAPANELVTAIEIANEMIHEHAAREPEYHGMGTTIVAARFARRKRRAFIAHVGDSRCYRLRDGQLKLLTTDHTVGGPGVAAGVSGYVRRALGVRSRVKVDVVVDCPQPEDLYLLCSDGLNKMVSDDEARMLLDMRRNELGAAAQSLVDAANKHGGKDNVTVILVRVRETEKNARKSGSTRTAPVGLRP